MSISRSWKRIETWIAGNAPEGAQLPEGASDELLDKAESELGIRLPQQVRKSYSIHNGSAKIWFFDQGYLMPIYRPADLPKKHRLTYSEVVDSCLFMRGMVQNGTFDDPGFASAPNGPIRPDWWNCNWIPITANDSGDHLCLDLAPLKGGRKGQVIDWWHERGAGTVIASNFESLLSNVADEFEAGNFVYNEQAGKIKKI